MNPSIRQKALALYKLGIKYPQGSRKSQELLQLSINTDPTFSYAYFEKSVPYNKRGDYKIGFELLNTAVSLNPRMHMGYRGWLRMVKLKDFKGCINDLKELITISPHTKKAWGQNINYLIGIAYKELKEFDLALTYFDIYLSEIGSDKVDSYVFMYKCIIHIQSMNYDSAKQDILEMIKYNNASPEGHYYLAILYRLEKDLDKYEISLRHSKHLFDKGYAHKNIYNEVTNELYLSDIIKDLASISS